MTVRTQEEAAAFADRSPRSIPAALGHGVLADTLIKFLEEKGIGRPSTYSPTISTILDRGYVVKEQKSLKPTDLGKIVNEKMVKHFENIVDIFQLLWENIVLEVPLQFTKVEDLSKFHGDGWKLISEDDYKTSGNNPFSDLLKDFEEE